MPLTGPSSYPPTIAEFLAHWTDVEAAAGLLVLPGGVARAVLVDLGTLIDAKRDEVTAEGLEVALARADREALITRLQARLVQFNEAVRGMLPGSRFARVLPEAFTVGEAEGTVRERLRLAAGIWAKVDALDPVPAGATLPLQLAEGSYDRATFDADREALRVAYGALSLAEVALRLAREERNDLQDRVRPILRDYRARVPVAFPPGHALVDSLPAYSPSGTRTPEPVAAEGVWQASTSQAKITWEASEDAELLRYEVRGVPGAVYLAEDETVLATVLPAAARELFTGFALGTPGLSASFKVYVVLTTGHERGSEPVTVTRPA